MLKCSLGGTEQLIDKKKCMEAKISPISVRSTEAEWCPMVGLLNTFPQRKQN